MKKSEKQIIVLSFISVVIIFCSIALILNWSAIFQKGTPFPYIRGMIQLQFKNKEFALVRKGEPTTYITKKEKYDEFHNPTGDNDNELYRYIESKYKVTFEQRIGGTVIFRSNEKVVNLETEIYWKNYIVWTVSVSDTK